MLSKDDSFPYKEFGVRLEIPDENRIAWFKDNVDLQKHLDRYKLDKKKITINYRNKDEEPNKSSKTDKKTVRQGAEKNSNRSTNTNRKLTKSMNADSNIPRTRKSKKQ